MFDFVIRGGTVIDGTRANRFRADVGIRADRIESVGDLRESASRELIDAAGKIVAPGFVDVHNHSDGWMLKTTHLEAKTRQGFTTEVLAADGISYAPVNQFTATHWLKYLRALNALEPDEYQGWKSLHEYMQAIDGRNVQNAMTHIPYANIRSMVCGWGRQAVDDFQMRQIQYEIRRAMQDGAVGLSTGLDYIVQCFATTDELVEACSAMAEFGGLYVTHVRYKKGLLPAVKEAVEIGRRAGVPVHISHLKAPSPRQADEMLDYIDRVARHEVDFSFDVYPYQPGSTMLSYLLPYDVFEDGPLAACENLASPETRARFAEGLKSYRLDMDHVRFAWIGSEKNAPHVNKTLNQYTRDCGVPIAQALCDLLVEEQLAVLCVMDEGDDALVHPFLQHDLYMMGSDGIYFPNGFVHPRVYGSAGRLLGRCVRDWKLFSLEDAVHKLSGRAAERFGLKDRGVIRQGNFADLVVFDAEKVIDPATYAEPHQMTVGIEHVLVNGRPIIRDAEICQPASAPLPGRYVKFHK